MVSPCLSLFLLHHFRKWGASSNARKLSIKLSKLVNIRFLGLGLRSLFLIAKINSLISELMYLKCVLYVPGLIRSWHPDIRIFYHYKITNFLSKDLCDRECGRDIMEVLNPTLCFQMQEMPPKRSYNRKGLSEDSHSPSRGSLGLWCTQAAQKPADSQALQKRFEDFLKYTYIGISDFSFTSLSRIYWCHSMARLIYKNLFKDTQKFYNHDLISSALQAIAVL